MRRNVSVIGLTGGIASGKSTVAEILKQQGAVIIDADKLGHQAYEPGTESYKRILELFGNDIVGADGLIDRRKLGGIVFGSPDKMKELTDIVWPAIASLAKAEIEKYNSSEKRVVVVLEAAVLIEASWNQFVDAVWMTEVPVDVAKERLMKRNNLSEEEAMKRINAQLTNEERGKHAAVRIPTNMEREAVNANVTQLYKEYCRTLDVLQMN